VSEYPAPPWRLNGPAAIGVNFVERESVRALVPENLKLPARCLTVVLVARYEENSTLQYGEAAGLVGPIGRGTFWVTHMWVDLPASRAGGREIWGMPKELASFVWRDDGVTVHADGTHLLSASYATEPFATPFLPALGYFAGGLDGPQRRAPMYGRTTPPSRATIHVPEGSPLRPLAPARAAAVRVDVRAGAAKPLS
jgi:hypothetical protein